MMESNLKALTRLRKLSSSGAKHDGHINGVNVLVVV